MFSLYDLEVEIFLIPSFLVFLLLLLPFPVVSKLISRVVGAVATPMLVVTVVLFFLFFLTYRDYLEKFDDKSSHEPPLHTAHSELSFKSKKWRAERNMYIHALTACLFAAIMKISRLNEAKVKLEKLLSGKEQKNKWQSNIIRKKFFLKNMFDRITFSPLKKMMIFTRTNIITLKRSPFCAPRSKVNQRVIEWPLYFFLRFTIAISIMKLYWYGYLVVVTCESNIFLVILCALQASDFLLGSQV